MQKKYTGLTANTTKTLILGSGAFFKSFVVGTDTYASAVTGGKLIGATKSGGQFEAKPEIRHVEVDGLSGKVKGNEVLEGWDVSMTANILELTKDNIKMALGAAKIETLAAPNKHDKISGKVEIEAADYVDNITFVGTLAGSTDPIIIQVYNALCMEGMSLAPKDKDDVTIAMKFIGHIDPANLDVPPFAIFYPKA